MHAGFLEIYDKYLDFKKSKITEGSFKSLKKLRGKIEKLELIKKRKLYLSDMTLDWFQKFVKLMSNGRLGKCTNSTLRHYVTLINGFLSHCQIFGYKVNMDYIKFREFMKLYKPPKFDRPVLLDEELAALWNFESYLLKNGKRSFLTLYKQKVRDLFVFQTQVGFRWGDVGRLKKGDIIEKNGKYYINNFTTQKRKSNVSVQLNQLAMRIIRMYCKRFDVLSNKSYIFKDVPDCSNATHQLKWIAKKANLDRKVEVQIGRLEKVKKLKKTIYQVISTHIARSKFATDWIMAGKDVYKLKTILGHASVKTTERYIRTLPGWIPNGIETEMSQETKSLFNL